MPYEKIIADIKRAGLKDFLLNNHGTPDSLSLSQSTISKTPCELYYYDEDRTEENVLVNVSEIEGVSRVNGYSWYEYLDYGVNGIPRDIPMDDINLNTVKFLNLLEGIQKMSLDDLKAMYRKTYGIKFLCFQRDGQRKYFQISDGNHRVILAKVLGIEKILAKSVTYYTIDYLKYDEYERVLLADKKLREHAESKGFIVVKRFLDEDYDDFGYMCDDKFVYILRYPLSIKVLKNGDGDSHHMIHNAKVLDEILDTMDKKANKLMKLYRIFPKKVRQLMKKYYLSYVTNNLTKPLFNEQARLLALNRLEK